MEHATLGGGCFWCLDAVYRQVRGVENSVCGYAGGTAANPSYEDVHTGDTGHAEVVQLTFDPKVITYETLLDIFWTIHDPTSLNRQGHDVGPEYRSIILYDGTSQHRVAEDSMAAAAKLWKEPIVTELVPLKVFYPAEEAHQNFFEKHPEFAYCQVIINPKLHKLQQKFARLLK
ncbi:MAG TPA: peptide-methionine (S)-S-oxide reductase MsrA [Candidatus Saccharimonadales bacterium]|nr:peptide-methionine (S)-S-oxide reductase MsrA [Candidatus Saccharimonadales bacterium]